MYVLYLKANVKAADAKFMPQKWFKIWPNDDNSPNLAVLLESIQELQAQFLSTHSLKFNLFVGGTEFTTSKYVQTVNWSFGYYNYAWAIRAFELNLR